MHKKTVPAVWFQNKLNPGPASVKKPEALELFEAQLAQVTGGLQTLGSESCSGCPLAPDECCD